MKHQARQRVTKSKDLGLPVEVNITDHARDRAIERIPYCDFPFTLKYLKKKIRRGQARAQLTYKGRKKITFIRDKKFFVVITDYNMSIIITLWCNNIISFN